MVNISSATNGSISEPKKANVFISYTHDTSEHRERCLSLKVQLCYHGLECVIDRDVDSPEEGWPLWCQKQIKRSDFVLIVCTQTYLRRFDGEEEIGKGKGAIFEGFVIRQSLYDAQCKNTKFIPVLFSRSDACFIPDMLAGSTHYVVTDESDYQTLYRRLTNQKAIIHPPKGELKTLDSRIPKRLFPDADPLADKTSQLQSIKDEPVRFSFAELKDVITVLHDSIASANPTAESQFDRKLIDLARKNELNGMGEEYFEIMIDADDPYSSRIQRFLSHPANEEVTLQYHEIVDELRRNIALVRDEFPSFEKILYAIRNAVINGSPDRMKGKTRTLSALLSYMYLQCDIGRKDDSSLQIHGAKN